ncbi:hypothetical protein BCR39DRAFT_577569 [Naematelia encephala]|uniref:Uncharacterized protein n=1 Tax=Naematelia encephala TaxID=71784 RepID=A0A1Y2AZP6_9TREE|nr:hypothetical protein BCR39DRAFT_577569 [Naematelia encephala]
MMNRKGLEELDRPELAFTCGVSAFAKLPSPLRRSSCFSSFACFSGPQTTAFTEFEGPTNVLTTINLPDEGISNTEIKKGYWALATVASLITIPPLTATATKTAFDADEVDKTTTAEDFKQENSILSATCTEVRPASKATNRSINVLLRRDQSITGERYNLIVTIWFTEQRPFNLDPHQEQVITTDFKGEAQEQLNERLLTEQGTSASTIAKEIINSLKDQERYESLAGYSINVTEENPENLYKSLLRRI